jgi:hypothetical protein
MAGTLVVDAVKSSTTGAPTFQNSSGVEQGQLCKAWANFAGASGTIRASFNVSSITRASAAKYTINFTNAMPDANYAVTSVWDSTRGSGWPNLPMVTSLTTTSFTLWYENVYSNTYPYTDPTLGMFSVFR